MLLRQGEDHDQALRHDAEQLFQHGQGRAGRLALYPRHESVLLLFHRQPHLSCLHRRRLQSDPATPRVTCPGAVRGRLRL